MLSRTLEPEVMDTAADALDYDRMDHREVNRRFVDDFLAAAPDLSDVLDLGTGTAQIPIVLCRSAPDARVVAIDLSGEMLTVAKTNVEVASLRERIMLEKIDVKGLPYLAGRFSAVMSNSIVHHIPDPAPALAEAVRVVRHGGAIFIRDLARPDDETKLQALVAQYTVGANDHQRQLFADSLHAALTVAEMQEIVRDLGFAADTVAMTSDRHWTWSALKL
jgi:ubiquinone/menaquinone biosynthesis C-methylase UbiE